MAHDDADHDHIKLVVIGDSKVMLEACYQPAAVQCYITKLFNTEPHMNVFLQVGKTSITSRYTDNVFDDTHTATIGVEVRVMQYNLSTQCCLIIDLQSRHLEECNCKVKLQIWDLAGDERFRTITRASYRGAHVICCVFDVTNRCVRFIICEGAHLSNSFACQRFFRAR